MENVIDIIKIGVPLLGALISNVVWVVSFLKSKTKSERKDFLKDSILGVMEDAEKMQNYTAEEKKQYVITRVKEFVIEHRLQFTDDQISKYIERYVDFSNVVNIKKKGGKK